MYNEDHIELLNELGVLSSPLLMRRFKITFEEAREILHSIMVDYENTIRLSENKICIDGRENDFRESQIKRNRNKKIKYKEVIYEIGMTKYRPYWNP